MSQGVGLSYGRGHLPVRLPDDARATVIRKTPLPKIADPREAVHLALDRPVGAESLKSLARGTPVTLDRRLVEADLKIVTGLVEPHFMAGYSSGRKVIAPGVAHAETIRTFHNSSFMEHPLARSCNLAGNPLHEEQLEIVRMLGEVYALNTIIDDVQHYSTGLSGDERGLTGVDMVDSVERAIGESLARSSDRDVAIIPEGPYVVPFCR